MAGKFAKLVSQMKAKGAKNPDALAMYVGAKRGEQAKKQAAVGKK